MLDSGKARIRIQLENAVKNGCGRTGVRRPNGRLRRCQVVVFCLTLLAVSMVAGAWGPIRCRPPTTLPQAAMEGTELHRLGAAGAMLAALPAAPVSGTALMLTMLLIAAATLVSEDLTCIGAGLLAARGTIGFVPAAAAAFAGILVGDVLLYLTGRFLGRPALSHAPLKWLVGERDIERTSRWFNANGPVIILTSRFLPGSRLPTYVSAGVLGTGFWQFTLYFALAAALWTPLLVGISAAVGVKMFDVYDAFAHYGLWVVAATVLGLWAALKVAVPLLSHRGRRLLLSSYRRTVRWEFWPPYVFYLPVLFYVVGLMIRHRSITLFTAANPGIPESGFVGESKSGILDGFHSQREWIARYCKIDGTLSADEKIATAQAFMTNIRTGYPVVLKPDRGQRGKGVAVVRSETALATYLQHAGTDHLIVQEYVDGHEFGIFYVRFPDAPTGRIISITDKRLPTLTGDGRRTLEQLILADDRAVCMARFHMRNHGVDLYRVPSAGETVTLVEVGTHARGALFLDGRALMTARLEAAFDRISKGFDGFYFGRYDVRTASVDDFRQGFNFKIVELNGVTSEATHIYNPGNRLFSAYRVLMRQWRTAFAVGRINRDRGVAPASLRRLARLLIDNWT
jgi:membrane protein DedA with SNARE-associated domain